MTNQPSIGDMFEELMTNYIERYHEEGDFYNPDGYEYYLNSLDDDEFIEVYNETFGDY
jgi:hypothetical protein